VQGFNYINQNFGTEFNYFADRIKFILVNKIALL